MSDLRNSPFMRLRAKLHKLSKSGEFQAVRERWFSYACRFLRLPVWEIAGRVRSLCASRTTVETSCSVRGTLYVARGARQAGRRRGVVASGRLLCGRIFAPRYGFVCPRGDVFPESGFCGGVAERSNATGCKPVDLRVYVGSNPTPSRPIWSGCAYRKPRAEVWSVRRGCAEGWNSR